MEIEFRVKARSMTGNPHVNQIRECEAYFERFGKHPDALKICVAILLSKEGEIDCFFASQILCSLCKKQHPHDEVFEALVQIVPLYRQLTGGKVVLKQVLQFF